MKVLVIGSGGREHCLCWKIRQSSLVDELYCAPGNGGTAVIAENVDIPESDIDGLLEFALDKRIDLTVVGPEIPLVCGIVDKFQNKGLKIFGPSSELALLEGSKIFAKKIMKKYRVPTPGFEVFDDPDKAKVFLRGKNMPLVIKADGLAAGKGVIICESAEEADKAIDLIMVDKKFGHSGDNIIVEEFLEGEELSLLVLTDGQSIVPLVSSRDHKRVFEGDKGPNTGGMGAYSPASFAGGLKVDDIVKEIFVPLIEGLNKEGKVYKGILYGGLMIKNGRPYVLEFNVRFGDPETQAILPKLKSDLVEVMVKTVSGELKGLNLEWDNRPCICVVLTSGGYPGSYNKGKEISGLEKLNDLEDIFVFHAGTQLVRRDSSSRPVFITSGGRVLNVAGISDTLEDAQTRVYEAVKNIRFDNIHYRKDIGAKAV